MPPSDLNNGVLFLPLTPQMAYNSSHTNNVAQGDAYYLPIGLSDHSPLEIVLDAGS